MKFLSKAVASLARAVNKAGKFHMEQCCVERTAKTVETLAVSIREQFYASVTCRDLAGFVNWNASPPCCSKSFAEHKLTMLDAFSTAAAFLWAKYPTTFSCEDLLLGAAAFSILRTMDEFVPASKPVDIGRFVYVGRVIGINAWYDANHAPTEFMVVAQGRAVKGLISELPFSFVHHRDPMEVRAVRDFMERAQEEA